MHTIYIALGSNLGDRAGNIHAALRALGEIGQVRDTSFLYETPPAYVADQPPFLNAVCRLEMAHAPLELLGALKQIERRLGRVKTVRYGPRAIDLDILFFDDLSVDEPSLTIPHALMAERAFVLQPLCDIAPEMKHPVTGRSVREMNAQLGAPPLQRVMPFGKGVWRWGGPTCVMGIINATPDSFSGDGMGRPGVDAVVRAVAQAEQMAADGAHCVDIGGMSTRPGHELISVDEEMDRVLSVIAAIHDQVNLPISVDTFRAEVAEEAISAGATLINDVWGLRFDARVADVAAKAGAPLVVMHNRSRFSAAGYESRLGAQLPPYEYTDLLGEISAELRQGVRMAQARGVARWNLIADPGIGFGKTVEQHLQLIRELDRLDVDELPILFGPSRKSFIGKVLGGLAAPERVEGTIAACVMAIARGAAILRVHDVRAVSRAARMADAILGKSGPFG
ncbi:MAG: dihydropteroate synthase [Caldilineaceae bacterium]